MTTIRFKLGANPTGAPEFSTAARTLALAHYIDREIRVARWKTCAEAGRALGIGESRVQKVLMLRFLPAEVQAEVLLGRRAISERRLRSLAVAHVSAADSSHRPAVLQPEKARAPKRNGGRAGE